MRRTLLPFVLCLAACAPPARTSPGAVPAAASPPPSSPVARIPSAVEWKFHVKAAGEARQRKDWAARRAHLEALHAMAPHAANLLVSLAQDAMRRDDRAGAIAWLNAYAATGLTFAADEDPLLAPLTSDPAAAAVRARLAANDTPVSRATEAFALPTGDQLFEDLAWDSVTRRLFVASVRGRTVVSVAPDGSDARPLTATARDGVGVLGVALDSARRTLWITQSPLPHAPGHHTGDETSVPCAVVAVDPSSGAERQRVELPVDGTGHLLSDLAMTSAGDVLVSDGEGGGLYVLAPGATRLERFPAPFVSPQTPAPADERVVFVPDYALGIARIDLQTQELTWLAAQPNVALEGIDGLYRIPGVPLALLAVQNGTTPRRILRLSMTPDGRSVTSAVPLEAGSAGLGEPTHGTWVDGAFWFLARSGWARFDDDGKPVARGPPDAPAVWRISGAAPAG